MSPFLLGVSLSLQDRALGGAYTFAHGEASGFFFFRTQPRAQDLKLPRGRPNVPVRLFPQSSFSFCWIPLHPARFGVSIRAVSTRAVCFFSKKVEGTQQNVRGWAVYYRRNTNSGERMWVCRSVKNS